MEGFFFETKKGNQYFYSDSTGVVKYVDNIKAARQLEKENKTKNCILQQKVELEDIHTYLKQNGTKELFLIVTEDCNLRCKYCAYSGNYYNMRIHRQVYMESSIAKEAVKKYLNTLKETKRRNPYLKPIIGFYGGEPLLNFDLIKEVINYAKKIYKGCFFTLTTNGILLRKEIADFLAQNEVAIAVSLNGQREEHDRLRVFPDHSGSFDIILKNLINLSEKYSDYYKKFCSIIVCYDYGSDIIEMSRFFDKQADLLKVARVNMISDSFGRWYKRYSKEDKEKFFERMEYCKQMYFEHLKRGNENRFLSALIGTPYTLILNRSINILYSLTRPKFLPFTATCVPGTKVAVDPDGNLHCCEKMNYNFPIGNVQKWLEIEKIGILVEKYNSEITKDCLNCCVKRLCPLCFALTAGIEKFEKEPADVCEKIRKSIKKQFEEVWSLLEDGVDLFDIVTQKGYKQGGVFL
ncbi:MULTISPECIES: radical SAM protein [Petrotoga]|nr:MULTISPECIES: radical SAM protein [Petrotoga]MDN5346355.1 uncharacterized protein [Petrotoga sp.]